MSFTRKHDIGISVMIVHSFAIFLFLVIWGITLGFGIMRERLIWYVPLLGYLVSSFFNMFSEGIFVSNTPTESEISASIRDIKESALKVIPVLSIIVAVPLLIKDGGLPLKSFQLASIAFLCLLVGVIPYYWAENKNVLFLMKHVKSALFHQAISWLVASGISVGFWLRII